MTLYETILARLQVDIDNAALKAYKKFITLLNSNVTSQEALTEIYLSFKQGSYNMVVAALMAKSFTELLQRPFTPTEILNLKVGGIKLSTKLYQNSQQVAQKVTETINANNRLFSDLRKLSLELFSGYNQKPSEVLKFKDVLPKYLLKAYYPVATELDKEVARITALKLRTEPLRAAYLQLVDRVTKGAGKKALENALKTSVYEKSRFLSTRIAKQETSRAYNTHQAIKIRNREDVQYVQVRYSGRHEFDCCNAFGDVDRFGQGKGVYPKGKAPVPPYHIGCACRLVSVINISTSDTPKENLSAERKFYDSLSEEEQKKLLPQGGRDFLENGGSTWEYLNRRTPDDYKIKPLSDVFSQLTI